MVRPLCSIFVATFPLASRLFKSMSSKSAPKSAKCTPSKKKGAKSDAILIGSLEVFKKDGYAAASMDRIASAAGVSKPTLYTHFKNKEGLFTALIHQMAKKNGPATLKKEMANLLQLPPEQVLRTLATTALDDFARDRTLLTLMRLIIGESERFPQLAQIFVREISKPNLEALTAYFTAQPQLNLTDPEVAARLFTGALVHHIIVQEIMNGKEIMPMDRDRMINSLIDMVMARASTQT